MPKVLPSPIRFEFRSPSPEGVLIASGNVDGEEMATALGAALLAGHPDHSFAYEGKWDPTNGRSPWLFLVRQTMADFQAVPGAPPNRREPL